MSNLLGNFVGLAFNVGSNPVAVASLVPLVAAGLTFIRYWNYDPETHPSNVENVSIPDYNYFLSIVIFWLTGVQRIRFHCRWCWICGSCGGF